MLRNTIRFRSGQDQEPWLELRVDAGCAEARIATVRGAQPAFSFNSEHLGFVLGGLAYQAWGKGSHMAFRRQGDDVAIEFQGPNDRSSTRFRLPVDDFATQLSELGIGRSAKSGAQLL